MSKAISKITEKLVQSNEKDKRTETKAKKYLFYLIVITIILASMIVTYQK